MNHNKRHPLCRKERLQVRWPGDLRTSPTGCDPKDRREMLGQLIASGAGALAANGAIESEA
jgi:hypothetical protein